MKPRRKFTGEYKTKHPLKGVFLVLEMLSGQRSVGDISRKEGIKDTLLHEWRSEFIRNAPGVFSTPQAQAEQAQVQKVAELEQVIGRLTMAPGPSEGPLSEGHFRE